MSSVAVKRVKAVGGRTISEAGTEAKTVGGFAQFRREKKDRPEGGEKRIAVGSSRIIQILKIFPGGNRDNEKANRSA